jgi:sugar diacid utilization regulator
MTVQLDLSKKIAPANMGPVLSPKIIKSVAKKLQIKNQSPGQGRLALALYLQGLAPSQDDLKQALKGISFPANVVAVQMSGASTMQDEVLAGATEQCLGTLAEVSQAKVIGLHVGLGKMCVLMPAEASVDKLCAEIKKIARSFSTEVNIGICEDVASARDLPVVYSQACEIARIGERLWGKPYAYRKSDLGIIGAVVDECGMKDRAVAESEAILASLAKPKNLLPTLKLFFTHNMSPTEVARAGRIHRNTVIYRLEKIKNQTGLDPLDFNDASQLYLAISLTEINELGAVSCCLSTNASITEKVVAGLFCSRADVSDDKIREVMSSLGVTLPQDFAMFLQRNGRGTAIELKDSVIFSMPLGDDLEFSIRPIQGKRVVQAAETLGQQGTVAYLNSKRAKGHLSKALLVLVHDLRLGESKWPGRRVIAEGAVGGLLALTNSNRLRSYARVRAGAIIAEIQANRQLERTATALLDSSLNLTLAASRLKVHRNTLIYRVGRIRQATGYDLTRFEDALQIRLALLMA